MSQLELFPVEKTAVISDCGTYRYQLTRRWGDGPLLGWIMLNPSKADHRQDDPTVIRCMARARDGGYDGIRVVNLFALRATDPGELRTHRDPVGPENDRYLTELCRSDLDIVLAWGNGGLYQNRSEIAENMLAGRTRVFALGNFTKAGEPKHPLFVAYDVPMYQLGWKS